MESFIKIVCVAAVMLALVSGSPSGEDSYLQALQNSQHPEFFGPPTGSFSYEPQPQVQPGYNYEHPAQPHAEYGPPQPEFLSHPPVTLYHEYPKHHSVGHYQHQPSVPEWLFSKLKLKLNLFTLGKILLKLIIFKKIVKFIAIICLLLFLPKLGALFKVDEPADATIEARDSPWDRDNLNKRLEESARQVMKSLEVYSKRFGSQKV